MRFAKNKNESIVGEEGEFALLIDRARRGAEDALTELYRRHNPRLKAYVKSISGFDADDVCSEVWLSVCRTLPGFKGDEPGFRGLLFTAARNRIKDLGRKALRPEEPFSPADIDIILLRDHEDPSEVIVEAEQAREIIERLTRLLPPAEAEIILLGVIGGLSVEEIAAVIKKSPGAIRSLKHKAIKRLSELLPMNEAAEDGAVRVPQKIIEKNVDEKIPKIV